MSDEHAYRVAAWWTSGRTGLAKSDSAPNAIHFTAPTEFGGLEGRWTPEELLLAAIAGCYTTTVRAIAGGVHFDFTDLQVEASGTVRKLPCSAGPSSATAALSAASGAAAAPVRVSGAVASSLSAVVSPDCLRGYFSMVCCTTAVIASGENGLVM